MAACVERISIKPAGAVTKLKGEMSPLAIIIAIDADQVSTPAPLLH
jgi:hypothetical protein